MFRRRDARKVAHTGCVRLGLFLSLNDHGYQQIPPHRGWTSCLISTLSRQTTVEPGDTPHLSELLVLLEARHEDALGPEKRDEGRRYRGCQNKTLISTVYSLSPLILPSP
jgi:hypothetical protein